MVKLTKLMELTIRQEQDINIEKTWMGDVLLEPTCGGTFKGDKLRFNVYWF